MTHDVAPGPARPTSRPLTGALLFSVLGLVLLVASIGSLLMTGANLVGSGPDNTAAQHVMLCLGLTTFFAAAGSLLAGLVLRLEGR